MAPVVAGAAGRAAAGAAGRGAARKKAAGAATGATRKKAAGAATGGTQAPARKPQTPAPQPEPETPEPQTPEPQTPGPGPGSAGDYAARAVGYQAPRPIETGAGVLLGLCVWGVIINYLRGGPAQAKGWILAKLINRPYSGKSSVVAPAKPAKAAR